MPHLRQSLFPHLVVSDGAAAINFYTQCIGFKETRRLLSPDGKVLHSELQFGDQILMLSDVFRGQNADHCQSPKDLGGSTVTITLGVPDIDAAFAKALAGGARSTMSPTDMFWGDRYGKFIDPFGHHWAMATHKEDVSPEEIEKRVNKMFVQHK